MKQFILLSIGFIILFIIIDFGRCSDCKWYNMEWYNVVILFALVIVAQIFIRNGYEDEN